VPEVVHEPGEEEDGAASGDPQQLARGRRGARRDGDGEPRGEAGEDADAAEERRRPHVPAVAARRRDETLTERRAEECPRRREGGRKSDGGDRGEHVGKVTKACKAGV